MMVKDFINRFDHTNPDWAQLPAEWPDCDLQRLTFDEIGKLNGIKTLWEISRPTRPKQGSRVWQDPKGYQYLGVWQNAALLRVVVRVFTKGMIKGELRVDKGEGKSRGAGEAGKWEQRRKAQLDDAARSVVRNIEEGWKRPTTSEYLNFLGYSQASLEEVNGDIRDCRTDGFLASRPGTSLHDLGIDLKIAKGPDKGSAKGDPSAPGHPYYQPLSTLTANPSRLTYEMFLELINKTDYLLRKLVESLEKKLAADRQGYQIQQMKLRDKFRKTQTV